MWKYKYKIQAHQTIYTLTLLQIFNSSTGYTKSDLSPKKPKHHISLPLVQYFCMHFSLLLLLYCQFTSTKA